MNRVIYAISAVGIALVFACATSFAAPIAQFRRRQSQIPLRKRIIITGLIIHTTTMGTTIIVEAGTTVTGVIGRHCYRHLVQHKSAFKPV